MLGFGSYQTAWAWLHKLRLQIALLAFFVLGPILSTVYLARRARDRPALVGPGDLATRHLLCRRSRREMSTSAFVTGGEKQEPCPSNSVP